MKRLFFSITLVIGLLVGVVAFLLTSQTGLNWAYRIAQIMAPVELSITKLQGRLLGPVLLEGLLLTSDDELSVEIERGRLNWSPSALLKGQLLINELSLETVNVSRTLPIPTLGKTVKNPIGKLPEINLPIDIMLTRVGVKKLSIINRQGDSLSENLINSIALRANLAGDQLRIDEFNLAAEQGNIVLTGNVQTSKDYPLEVAIRGQLLRSGKTLLSQAILQGDMEKLKIKQTLSGPIEGELIGTAHNLLTALDWQATFTVNQIDTQWMNSDWPALSIKGKAESLGSLDAFSLTGSVTALLENKYPLNTRFLLAMKEGVVTIDSIKADYSATQTTASVSGDIKLATKQFSGSGDWHHLRWPLTGVPTVESESGSIKLSGNLNTYQFGLSGDVKGTDIPAATINLKGTGGRYQAKLDKLDANLLNGSLTGSGIIDWHQHLMWQLALQGKHINPGVHWSQWPGTLNANATTKGYQSASGLVVEVSIDNLDGRLRQYPIKGSGHIKQQQNQLFLDQMILQSGSSSMTVNGVVSDHLDIVWSLDSSDLESVLPKAGGSLTASGKIQGPKESVAVTVSARGDNIFVQGNRLKSLSAEVIIDLAEEGKTEALIRVDQPVFGARSADSIEISLGGLKGLHTLSLALKGDAQTFDLSVTGGLSEESVWTGQLKNLQLTEPDLGTWELDQPMDIHISRDQVTINKACLQHQRANICGDFEREGQKWSANASINQFLLSGINVWLPHDIAITGTLDGTLRAWSEKNGQVLFQSDIQTSEGQVQLDDEGEEIALRFAPAKASLKALENGAHATLNLTFIDAGNLKANLAMPEWQITNGWDISQEISGQLQINANQTLLKLVNAAWPEVESIRGNLTANVDISGDLGVPLAKGQLTIDKGQFVYPALGLDIHAIQLQATGDSNNQLKLNANAKSGSGSLSIVGNMLIQPKHGWPAEIKINGNRFQLINNTEAQLEISPQLEIKSASRQVEIRGQVMVPQARLEPKSNISRGAQVSSDVVVVSADQLEDPERQPEKWKIDSEVQLLIGDRVYLDGFGLSGRLSGDLLLVDEPDKLTLAHGSLNIHDGLYQAYGQNLTVERGRLIFANSLVDDPGLDIQAFRQVSNIRAGVRVGGTLKMPELTLYSVPAMSESDALSYLLLGRALTNTSSEEGSLLIAAASSFGMAQGESLAKTLGASLGLSEVRIDAGVGGLQDASLVLGRYLSPKLYLKYVTELTGVGSVIQLQYQLNKYFELQSEAGTQTGIDLYYTIER